MMATRTKTTSLKRRLIWTLGCATLITLISTVSIVSYRSSRQEPVNQEPALLAEVVGQADADNSISDRPISEPNRQFKVIQTAAVELDGDSPGDKRRSAESSKQPFVEQIPGTVPAGNFRSAKYDYLVSLAGTRWTRWDDLTTVMPEAEWGALLKNYGRFLVMPVELADADMSAETVDRTMLAQFGFQFPNNRSTDLETIHRWGAEGHVFRMSRDISGRENIYRIWILRRDRNAYLVAAWIDRTAAMNSLNAEQNSGAPPINGDQLDDIIDSQLDTVLARFRLVDTSTDNSQSRSNQWQPLRHLVRFRPLQALFDR